MKSALCLITFWIAVSNICIAQGSLIPMERPAFGLPGIVSDLNLSSFSPKRKPVTNLWQARNSRLTMHPDAGYIAPEQPPGNVVEILEKRTETTRFYIDVDTPGKVFSQGSYGAMHYKRNGQWLIIDPRLEDKGSGRIEASHQPEPVGFDMNGQRSYIATAAGKVFFNSWKLYGVAGKKSVQLGTANWKDYTAGDDGVKVRNIFPGVDAEMHVQKGRIKTNLIVRSWGFQGYDSFVFSDTYGTGGEGRLVFSENPKARAGIGEVEYRAGTKMLARIGKAVAYAKPEPQNVAYLSYSIRSNELRIHVSAEEIAVFLLKGPLVIDPLVMGPEYSYKPGSVMNSYNNVNCSSDFNEACSYSWTIPIPPMVTVTKGYFKFSLTTLAPCTRDKMRFRYGFGNDLCGRESEWWTTGLPATPGNTGGNVGVSENYNTCFQPGCEITYAKATFSIVRACMGPAGCESSCVQGIGPFVTTIEGRTLEMVSASGTPQAATCSGDTIKLFAEADYGVKPYTYLWTPGNLAGKEVYVHPTESTAYRVTVRDACNQEVSKEVRVAVPAAKPPMSATITGPSEQACEGQELTFTSKVADVQKPAFQWRINGVDVPGATADRFNANGLANGDRVALLVTNMDDCANPRQLLTEPIVVATRSGKPYDQNVPVVGCDSVVYGNQIFLRDTTISETLKNSFGCDSVHRVVRITIQHFSVHLNAVYRSPLNEGESFVLKADGDHSFAVTSWEPAHLFADHQRREQSVHASAGDNTYTVYAQSEAGCKDSASVVVRAISRPSGSFLPNVFTPDGDGLNDLWVPLRASEFPVGELFVYNRWGSCIYHTEDYRIPWDGRYRGARVPAGVYAYRLVIDKKFEINDSVTILY